AEQRRFDAFRDLLLGRDQLPLQDGDGPCQTGCGCRAGQAAPCGCRPGQPVPCGAALAVHVPLGGALGTTDEPAELVGHGPLEPDLLAELLLSAPRLRPVWVGQDGTPVAVGDRVIVPDRGDRGSVRDALLRLASPPPPELQPRHPQDHALDHRPDRSRDHPPAAQRDHPPDGPPDPPSDPPSGPPSAGTPAPAAPPPGAAHPADSPGGYRPPRRLRRLIAARAPRCEWPGCGARAVRCDAEHDLAWPDGPTCACNLGPCCRRHHQVKQHGWTKTRTDAGVRWTGRTGRDRLAPSQHEPVAEPVRPLPAVPTPSPLDELSPLQVEAELAALDLLPTDDWTNHLPPADHEPEDTEPGDTDRLGHRLLHTDIGWTLDLADPYRWLDPEAADER
ncbi:MAG TPA: hypothetical protein VFO77_09605, partial [Actinoplanes sp.]|nr:hypothetical protein [Actinoplanes sp.]